MPTHLTTPLEPGDAPRHAAAIVAAAADISGAELDYSADSLAAVEDIVDGFRAAGATGEDMVESLVAFGCYVGEMLNRQAGGTWGRPTGVVGGQPVVVLPGARECHPVDWVFRRLRSGDEVSIRDLYAAALASGADGADGDGHPDH
ncbi:hypothetical protein SAMN05216223_12394 [Actinacidiphila yanglinensis]|uniref:Uncharacterized protein n=1 Tax=Actinacidiphila yanglinensis TaxID=310779 RepID=A0A1H6E185_9ACTN|nr:hypothetical protein [Actinacidiphila yanglinensis]SEG91360.1 hypothetical protein SAMN05216223_12394 [Actinacidiphila yanglinensis]